MVKMFVKQTIFIVIIFAIVCSGHPVDLRPQYAFSHETTLRIRGAMSICLAETGADPNSIEVIRQGKYCLDEPFKKFIHCSYSKSGYSHSDGSINICKVAAEFSDEERMKKVMEKCNLKIRNNPVETSFAFFKCFQETSPVVVAL